MIIATEDGCLSSGSDVAAGERNDHMNVGAEAMDRKGSEVRPPSQHRWKSSWRTSHSY